MAYFGPVNTSLDRSIICHSLSLLLSKLPNHLLFIPILLIPAELYSFKCIYRFCQFVCLFGFYIKAAHQCHILMSHMGKMRGVYYDGVFTWRGTGTQVQGEPLVAFYDMPGRQWTYSRNPLPTGSPLLDRLLHHAGDTVGRFFNPGSYTGLLWIKFNRNQLSRDNIVNQ